MKNAGIAVACLSFATLLSIRATAGEEVTASKSLIIQPSGPRDGDGGSKYFNVEGKDNGKYASFGVLVFEMRGKIAAAKIKSVTLTLVQSVPGFAKDGDVKIFLAPDLDPEADLKFDASSDNGIGNQIKPIHELGTSGFKKVKTGETHSLSLKLDETGKERIAKEGRLCLVVVPADATVAATYFGAGESDERSRPKLVVDAP